MIASAGSNPKSSENSKSIVAQMRQRAPWPGVVAMCLGLCIASGANAAERQQTNRFELTPFAGLMSGGDFEDPVDDSERSLDDNSTWGLLVDIADEPWRHYEFLYTQQGTEVGGITDIDMDVQYLHLGGIVSHPDAELLIPYFGLTVGAARFSPDVPGLSDETKLSFSAGGGLRIPFADHFGVRLDLRAFMTVLDSDSEIFCGSNPPAGGCRIQAKSDTFLQYAASLGVIFAF